MAVGRIALFIAGGVLAVIGAAYLWSPKIVGLAGRPEAMVPDGATIEVRVMSADRVMIGSEQVNLAGYMQKLRHLSVTSPKSYILLRMVGQMSQADWDKMKAAIPANGLSGSATSAPINMEAGKLTSLPEMNAWVGRVK